MLNCVFKIISTSGYFDYSIKGLTEGRTFKTWQRYNEKRTDDKVYKQGRSVNRTYKVKTFFKGSKVPFPMDLMLFSYMDLKPGTDSAQMKGEARNQHRDGFSSTPRVSTLKNGSTYTKFNSPRSRKVSTGKHVMLLVLMSL